MKRPFLRYGIERLEAEFTTRRSDPDFLRALLTELEHRDNDRASRLKERAESYISLAQLNPVSRKEPTFTQVTESPSAIETLSDKDVVESRPEASTQTREPDLDALLGSVREMRPITNSPDDILAAWIALEVLSPQTFRRETDLTGGDNSAVARFDTAGLPWFKSGGGRPNLRLYYQVVLGTIKVDTAVAALVGKYGDTRPERHSARGEAILATVMLDRHGKPVEEDAVAISSFAWGVSKALSGDLSVLRDWQAIEKTLVEQLDRQVRCQDADGELLPLDLPTIHNAYQWLTKQLSLSSDLVQPPRFAVRSYQYYRNSDPPEPLILNSFFLNDLTAAITLWREGKATPNLKRHLQAEPPSSQRDLLHDADALMEAVAPKAFPPARWPGEGRHPLVLLQQASVNLATLHLKDSGILAVNGPPGTGKTTLLRDIVAAMVTARAEVMATFDDPAAAFTNSKQRIKAGNAWLFLYQLDPKLRGFEMLVASSNNKAVENVSAELPGCRAIAADAANLRYFKTLSDSVLGTDTWGMIAAVLGNAKNRSAFRNKFWWDEDRGMSVYLAHATGTPQVVEIKDADLKVIGTRPPAIVTQENAPRDSRQALQRWHQARKSFSEAMEKSLKARQNLQVLHQLLDAMPSLTRTLEDLSSRIRLAQQQYEKTAHERELTKQYKRRVLAIKQEKSKSVSLHAQLRPHFFARLFRTSAYMAWTVADLKLRDELCDSDRICAEAEAGLTDAENRIVVTKTA